MGDYLSFSFSRPGKEPLGEFLAPLFGGGFFQPVAVGAVEGHDSGYHWFLAGYALEDFLRAFLARRVPPLASVALATTQDEGLNAYHQVCAEALRGTVPVDRLRSPFEQVDARLGVTVLEPKHLSEEVLAPLTSWNTRFRRAVTYVYGSLALHLQKPSESTWSRVFQAVSPPDASRSAWADPFLTFRISAAWPEERRHVTISTREHVWLSQAQALGGRVTPDDADANLRGLAAFARLLMRDKPTGELHLEGSIFFREEARIRAAFQGLL